MHAHHAYMDIIDSIIIYVYWLVNLANEIAIMLDLTIFGNL